MKYIFLSFIALISFTSCQKKFNYVCEMNDTNVMFTTKVEKNCTESQIERFIKENTIDTDGSPHLYTQGDKWVTCTKK